MGLLNWLFTREDKLIMIDVPVPLLNAIETYTYIQNTHRTEVEGELTKDDVILLALAEYMERNLWTNALPGTVINIPGTPTNTKRPPRRLN